MAFSCFSDMTDLSDLVFVKYPNKYRTSAKKRNILPFFELKG